MLSMLTAFCHYSLDPYSLISKIGVWYLPALPTTLSHLDDLCELLPACYLCYATAVEMKESCQ